MNETGLLNKFMKALAIQCFVSKRIKHLRSANIGNESLKGLSDGMLLIGEYNKGRL